MELDTFLEHVGDVNADELYHHGVKGMKWGVHRSGHVSSTEIRAARERHYGRVDALHAHAAALSVAKSTAEKQRHLNEIHKIAKEARTSGDIEKAHRMTVANKVASGVIGSVVATPGIGTAAGLAGAHIYNQAHAKQSRAEVNAYENSTLKDYY